jgi:hypothetical protein
MSVAVRESREGVLAAWFEAAKWEDGNGCECCLEKWHDI